MYTGVLLFFTLGWGEIFIILVVVYLIFGPKQLPVIARKLGKVVHEVKKASADITREINREAEMLNSEIEAETKKLNNDVNIVKNSFQEETKKLKNELDINVDNDHSKKEENKDQEKEEDK